MPPLISIIITNYNYSKYLGTSIHSCLDQKTDLPYEIVLVDDGSTDNSLEIAASFHDSRLNIISRQNGGIEAASNEGINKAKGKYIVRVDADDYLLPDYLENIISPLADSSIHFVYSNYQVVDEKGDIQFYERLPVFSKDEIISRGDFLATGTVYVRSVVMEQGGYSEKVANCGLENYELILNLIQAGYTGMLVPMNLFSYRIHGNNISSKRRAAIIDYGEKLFNSFSLGSYTTNRFHPYKLNLDK